VGGGDFFFALKIKRKKKKIDGEMEAVVSFLFLKNICEQVVGSAQGRRHMIAGFLDSCAMHSS
jgi:hypothetical protein